MKKTITVIVLGFVCLSSSILKSMERLQESENNASLSVVKKFETTLYEIFVSKEGIDVKEKKGKNNSSLANSLSGVAIESNDKLIIYVYDKDSNAILCIPIFMDSFGKDFLKPTQTFECFCHGKKEESLYARVHDEKGSTEISLEELFGDFFSGV